jgi:hypothetical protein
MLLVANKIDISAAEKNLERMKELNYHVIPCCSEAELALRRAAEKQLIDYRPGDCNFKISKPEKLTESQIRALETIREKILLKLGSTGVQESINMAYFKLLNMITVYPVEDLEHLSDHNGRVLPDIYAVEARERKRVGEDYILKDRDVISIVSAKKRA